MRKIIFILLIAIPAFASAQKRVYYDNKSFLKVTVRDTTLLSGIVGIGTTSPNSKIHIAGSIATAYTGTATGITLDATHSVINVTATGQTITLPTAASITGRQYTIKLTASGSCTVATTSSQTIDGSTTYSLASQYKYGTVVSDGANWIVTVNN